MDTIVIARNRFRMYTAFITPDGRRVLNIAAVEDGTQRSVSIAFDEADEAALRAEDQAVVSRLLDTGLRIVPEVPTPTAGIPVSGHPYPRAA